MSSRDPVRWAVHEEEVVDTEEWEGREQEVVMTSDVEPHVQG